jgi:serine/threonine protein kinase
VKKGLGKPVTQPTRITDEHRIGPWAPQEVTKPAVIPAASDVQAFLSNLSCTHIISSNEAEHPGDQAPEYAAPEWLLGSSLSTTVDVWALACTIFELRTGVGLFDHAFHDALSEMDRFIVVDIHTSPPPKLGPIRSWLAELVGFSVADTLKKLNEDKFDPALVTYIGHRLDAAEKGDAGGSDEQFAMFMEQLKIKDEGDVMPHLKAKGMRLPKAPNLAKYEGPLLAVNPTAQMSPEERVLFEDLMCKMLRHDPDERIDMPQVLVHGWFGYQ